MEEERGEARGGRQQAQFEGRRVMYMAGGSSCPVDAPTYLFFFHLRSPQKQFHVWRKMYPTLLDSSY